MRPAALALASLWVTLATSHLAACHLAAGTDEFGDRPCLTAGGERCPGDGTCDDFGRCTCDNGLQDEGETDVDCGGRCVPDRRCAQGEVCGTDELDPSASHCGSAICCLCAGEFLCQPGACVDSGCAELAN